MELETPFEVLWADADPSGWIYYAAALRYVAEAETALFREAGLASNDTIGRGFAFPRVHVELDYKKPLKLGDRGAAHAGIGRIGSSSIRMDFRLTKGGDPGPSVEGHIDMVLVGVESGNLGRPIAVPKEMRDRLTAVRGGQRREGPDTGPDATILAPSARPRRSGGDG